MWNKLNSEIYYEFFNLVVEELIGCIYCDNEIIDKETGICQACELSIELTEALMVPAEA